MEQPDRIHLRDYIVATDIGAFQTERGHDQRLRFNLTVELIAQVIGVNDEVDRILSYDILTSAITTGLADRRYNLLETLAERIAAEVLNHPRAAQVEVSVEKLDRVPGALGVTLVRRAARVAASPNRKAPPVIFYGRDVPLPKGAAVLVPDALGLPLPNNGNQRRITLLALDQAAWALAGRLGLHVADSQTEIDWAADQGNRVVWAPSRMLADEYAIPSEPETLAYWLAERLNAPELIWAIPESWDIPRQPAGFHIPMSRVGGPV